MLLMSQDSDDKQHDPQFARDLFLYTSLENVTSAIEAERRRLADLLESSVIEQITLLLSQAGAYEQTLAANPTARMAVSVLSSLGRQALQQARDLQANLKPALLEALGLEPALEALVGQEIRTHGLQITLTADRLRERLPFQIELALFRLAQDALQRTTLHAHASRLLIQLVRQPESLLFSFTDNGISSAARDLLVPACQRIVQLGGIVTVQVSAEGSLELAVIFALEPPPQLTSREIETLQLLTQGLTNKEIARVLDIKARTVNFHLDNIYSKLGVSSRTEAVIYALQRGWAQHPFPDAGEINR